MNKTILFLFILSMGLSNCKDSEVSSSTKFNSGEVSFSNSKTNLSDISYSLGIVSLKEASLTDKSTFSFKISAEPSFVNGQKIDLNNIEVVLTKRASNLYDIISDIPSIGLTKLSLNTTSKKLTLNNEIIEPNLLSAKQHLSIVIMTRLFFEVTQNENNGEKSKGFSRSQKVDPNQNPYYGYTVGWGFTAEESADHESRVRSGASGTASQYGCTYLGTSTTCVFGSLGCTTISTFRCTGGSSNLG
jgi:hypothetical protein